VPRHARPEESKARITRLLNYWGGGFLSDVNGETCRRYAAGRSTPTAARRELEELRAAIRHCTAEGYCSEAIRVVLPPRPAGRERWLTRAEAARLVWAAWTYREVQKGCPTGRRSRKHVAKFILVGLYTGSRAGAVCCASIGYACDRPWIDLDSGIFYRKAAGSRSTKKKAPPIRLPDRLLAHLRRWRTNGQRFVVEWRGQPVKRCSKAFDATARQAKLEQVTPHVLRHTCATWMMQSGTVPWEAAGYLGMTVEMLSRLYGHHHPDHYASARAAFDAHRRRR
jgi:integrase